MRGKEYGKRRLRTDNKKAGEYNSLFSSTCAESELVESFTRTIEAIRMELGELLYLDGKPRWSITGEITLSVV
ncbi:hypothetical protein GOP47_0017474 [Adiantum capillus-veneris]|uniref:Uncharacterized protein n=1 Tax=Adiantum capillus-veneris TaxID=13818 RepID=A0A9D4UGM5_ADICA|nr:hypothetical protein GOP47_0017474 [Adiantum capillus-veneris]